MCVCVCFCVGGALIDTEPTVAGGSSSAAPVAADRGRNLSAGCAILTQQKHPQTKHTHIHRIQTPQRTEWRHRRIPVGSERPPGRARRPLGAPDRTEASETQRRREKSGKEGGGKGNR